MYITDRPWNKIIPTLKSSSGLLLNQLMLLHQVQCSRGFISSLFDLYMYEKICKVQFTSLTSFLVETLHCSRFYGAAPCAFWRGYEALPHVRSACESWSLVLIGSGRWSSFLGLSVSLFRLIILSRSIWLYLDYLEVKFGQNYNILKKFIWAIKFSKKSRIRKSPE